MVEVIQEWLDVALNIPHLNPKNIGISIKLFLFQPYFALFRTSERLVLSSPARILHGGSKGTLTLTLTELVHVSALN